MRKYKMKDWQIKTAIILTAKDNPHLGRPRATDSRCYFCLAYLALNDGAYGEHFEYAEMAEALRELDKIRSNTKND